MNVELIQALKSIQSSLREANNAVTLKTLNPFNEVEDSNLLHFLAGRIDRVCGEIDGMITDEEAVLDGMFAEYQRAEITKNSVISVHAVAADIRKLLCDSYISVCYAAHKSGKEKVTISAQPDGQFTPADIALLLKGRGYDVTFKKAKKFDSCKWAYFDVVQNGASHFKFEFHSTVASLEPPELERFDEPASDSHLVS